MSYPGKDNLLHLYSTFLGTQSALHSKGGISSSTTSVQTAKKPPVHRKEMTIFIFLTNVMEHRIPFNIITT